MSIPIWYVYNKIPVLKAQKTFRKGGRTTVGARGPENVIWDFIS